LEDKINNAKNDIEAIRVNLANIEQEKAAVTTELQIGDSQIVEEEKNYQIKSQEKESYSREYSRLAEEFELIDQETAVTLNNVNDLEAKQRQINADLAVYEESLNTAQVNLHNAQNLINQYSVRIQEIDVETARKQALKESLVNEKQALSSKISILEDEKGNILKNIEDIDKEKEDNRFKIDSFNREIENLTLKIQEDKKNIAGFAEKKDALEKQEGLLQEQIEETRKSGQILEKECETVRAAGYNKKLEIQSLEYEKEKIKDYLAQVYKIEFEPLAGETFESGLDDFLSEREKIKKKISSLGEVNLVAIEEFEELKKREEFLQKQKDDLVLSQEELKKAIQKINKTSKELFLETFHKIEEEFKKNFRFLFNGGRADLILIDPENVLESGVEIEVQPPGKKLQNVSLLSGGEKALTAISLIFAIFTVRPSPLCVLDEIDAPLDEANVDRFNHILREFAASSQFVVITHNKKTMSNADVLYGVTMQEKGLSKLVSVKFAADEKKVQNRLIKPHEPVANSENNKPQEEPV
jgi:chromosome segregation protein